MFRRHHAPPTAAHGRAARWFWRLMLFGPLLIMPGSSVYFYEVWVFPGAAASLPPKGEGWAYSSPMAFQISVGFFMSSICLAIAGINANSFWIAWPARVVALWWTGPILLELSQVIVRSVLGCTFYNTPPVSALCQVKADLRLPFPDMWPLAMPWPFA